MTIKNYIREESKRLEYIAKVIWAFGGQEAVAKICKVERSNVSKWQTAIPSDHILNLYRYSLSKGMGVDLADLDPRRFKTLYEEITMGKMKGGVDQ
jgi:hypothetical protein